MSSGIKSLETACNSMSGYLHPTSGLCGYLHACAHTTKLGGLSDMRKEDRHRVLRGGVIKCEEEEMERESKIRETRGHGGSRAKGEKTLPFSRCGT